MASCTAKAKAESNVEMQDHMPLPVRVRRLATNALAQSAKNNQELSY